MCGLSNQVEELKDKLRTLTIAEQMTQEAHAEQINIFKQQIITIKAKAAVDVKVS